MTIQKQSKTVKLQKMNTRSLRIDRNVHTVDYRKGTNKTFQRWSGRLLQLIYVQIFFFGGFGTEARTSTVHA